MKRDDAQTAVVMVGHGSSRNPETRKPIDHCADQLRTLNRFHSVQVGFLKESPYLSEALESITAAQVVIVPYFISDGYYTREVIPKAMGLAGAITRREQQTIYYAEPVGKHPLMAEIILHRAKEAGAEGHETLAVLGHGTPKNPHSAENVFLQSDRIRSMNQFPEVLTAFIDQDPPMESLFETAQHDRIVMVPFFVADGWHVSETIPEDLRRCEGALERHGKSLIYARSVGTDARMVEVVLAAISDT